MHVNILSAAAVAACLNLTFTTLVSAQSLTVTTTTTTSTSETTVEASTAAATTSAATASSAGAATSVATATGATYTNPILNAEGADPWVIQGGDGYYYMTFTNNANITLYRSKVLTDWNNAESNTIWVPPTGQTYSTDVWAPEIHNIGGLWYVIFTADPNYDTPPPEDTMYCTFDCPALYHRMYVLQSSGSDIWNSNYTLKGELNTYDQFAIDGTYFQYEGQLYHVYSCWYTAYESWPSNLCITQMSDPFTVSSNFTQRTIISVPTEPWEKTPYGRTSNIRLSSNEGPERLTSPITGQQFIIYSAARSDNPDYCLGQLALAQGGDPMNPSDWTKSNGCVFYQNKRENAYGVGHASFVQSPDLSEWWIVYHGMLDPVTGWSARTIRTQQFTWNEDGTPNFPRPGYGPYPVPAGQVGT